MTKVIQAAAANTMISDRFEVFHVKDLVLENNTLYHYHDFFEIHCTLEGEGVFYVDEHEYPLTPGTITLISPNDLHRILAQKTAAFERTYIFVTPQFLQSHSTQHTDLSEAFKALGAAHNRFLHMAPEKLRQLLTPLDQPADLAYGSDLEYESHFLQFLIEVNRLSFQNDPLPVLPQKKDDLITRVISYINEHLAENLTLDSLAALFFTNKYHLSREFKKSTSITLHQFVLKKRLLYSKQLLLKYGSATNVYPLCGFQSYTHFLRSFKQEFHLTPKEFLKRQAKNQQVQFSHYEDQQ